MNEIRFTPSQLHCRRASGGAQGGEPDGTRTISGYAIRFNEDSLVLDEWGARFTERIAPSCVTEEWLRTCDVKMTLFHNREKLLARYNEGNGSMRLSVDDKGVMFEFEAPDTELGRYAVEAIERGDLSGCSFAFAPGDYMTEERGEGDLLIIHTRFAWMGEMTIESDPAYPTTEVGVRSFCEGVKKQQEAKSEVARAAAAKAETVKRARKAAVLKARAGVETESF